MNHPDDTIAAIASAPGGAARGIVRLSGSNTRAVLESCFHADSSLAEASAATAVEGHVLLNGESGDAISLPATVFFWPDVRSYTRQPAAEIHLCGSPPLIAAVLSTVCTHGARLAGPGEFTMRAFLAGRLDLTQAEAVLGVIDARGDDDLQHALNQLAGGLGRPLHQLRETLLNLLAHLEAGLDFVEEDIEFVSREDLARQLTDAADLLKQTQLQLTHRRRAELPACVALVGWPNVGKSSLFNALVGGQALVSDQAGTTRDYVSAELDLDGIRCQLVDTAGYECAAPGETIDAHAQQLTGGLVAHCDVELFCLDSSRPANAWETERLTQACANTRLVVLTKVDGQVVETGAGQIPGEPAPTVATSARHRRGIADLQATLRDALVDLQRHDSHAVLTGERCGESLRTAQAALEAARELNARGQGEELVALELRTALGELGKVVGAVYTDDILDRVFSRFCIGK